MALLFPRNDGNGNAQLPYQELQGRGCANCRAEYLGKDCERNMEAAGETRTVARPTVRVCLTSMVLLANLLAGLDIQVLYEQLVAGFVLRLFNAFLGIVTLVARVP